MRFLMAIVAVLVIAACPLWASPVTLTDGNSTFTVDPTDNSGATYWSLDNVDQLYMQQWFYRLGPQAGVQAINTIGTPTVNQFLGTQGVEINYYANTYQVTLTYTLTGGSEGSGTSDVSEVFRIKNTGTTALNFDLFEYSDFDLQPNRSDDSALRLNANTIKQWDGVHVVQESVVRTPDRWQISNPFAITGDLSNSSGFLLNTDCAWAFQWNLVVAPGSSVVFSKDKAFSSNVPEPMSVMLGIMGLGAVSGFRRLRRK